MFFDLADFLSVVARAAELWKKWPASFEMDMVRMTDDVQATRVGGS